MNELSAIKTKIKHLEAELKEEKNRVESLRLKAASFFLTAPEGIMVIDRAGTLIEINDEFEKLTGLRRERVINRSIIGLVKAFVAAPHIPGILERIAALLAGKDLPRYELPFNDRTLQIITTRNPLKADFCISYVRDITDSELTEELLGKSEANLQTLIDTIPDPVWLKDPDGVYLHCNRRFEQLVNAKKSDIIGKADDDFFDEDSVAIYRKQDKAAIDAGKPIADEELVTFASDGHQEYMETIKTPVFGHDGKLIGVLGIARDISERKRAEMHWKKLVQAEKMASLGVLVSGVAHEINNPNNYLRCNAKIIGRVWKNVFPIIEEHYKLNPDFRLADLDYADARKLLPDIIRGLDDGTNRIKLIVDSLRNYARREPPDMNREVDVTAIVRSSLVLLMNLVQKSTDHFSFDCTDDPLPVRGNGQQLSQVVINLITNACQALRNRSQRLRVGTGKDGANVLLLVADEGYGIPPEDIGKVFDPFFTTKRDSGGMGLGLPISMNIIQNHGGTIEFDSVFGKGTTVTVRLPRAAPGGAS